MVTQQPSLSNPATDPLRNFKFQVTFTPLGSGGWSDASKVVTGFTTVQGLTTTITPIIYNQGGMNSVTQKMPATADFGPITLTKGVTVGANAWDLTMMQQTFSFIQGIAIGSVSAAGNGNSSTADFRYQVDIQVLQHPVTTANVPIGAWFRVYDAWPTTWTWADLDAGSNEVFISQVILVHGGFDVQYASDSASDAALV